MKKLDKIVKLLQELIRCLYTGCVVLHFNKGDVCKVEKHESLKI